MNHIDNIVKYVPDLKKRRILDLGCGRGGLLVEFMKKGYQVVGLDRNPDYLKTTADLASANGLTAELYQGEAESLPFAGQSFGFIHCNEVTEHAQDPRKMMNECFRILSPGGKMYINFHNRFGIFDYHYHFWFINWLPRGWAEIIIRLLNKQKKDNEAGKQKLSTMNYFTYRQALALIKESNFSYFDIRKGIILKGFPAKLGFNFLIFYLFTILGSNFHFILTKN